MKVVLSAAKFSTKAICNMASRYPRFKTAFILSQRRRRSLKLQKKKKLRKLQFDENTGEKFQSFSEYLNSLPEKPKPIDYRRRLATLDTDKAEAERLAADAENYNPTCIVECRKAFEVANQAALLFLRCEQIDETLRAPYLRTVDLAMEIFRNIERIPGGFTDWHM